MMEGKKEKENKLEIVAIKLVASPLPERLQYAHAKKTRMVKIAFLCHCQSTDCNANARTERKMGSYDHFLHGGMGQILNETF